MHMVMKAIITLAALIVGMYKWLVILITGSFLITSCCNKSLPHTQMEEVKHVDISQIAKKIMGQKPEIIPNADGSLHLCVIRNAALDLRFMVLDNNGSLIYPVKRIRGTVKWYNISKLAIQIDPGHIGRSEANSDVQLIDLLNSDKEEKL